MPYELDWVFIKRVIYVRNHGELSHNDIETMHTKIQEMLAEGIAPIHIIEDDREFNGLSQASVEMVHFVFKAAYEINYEKIGWAVVIVPESLTEIADLFGMIGEVTAHVKYHRVETLPEALEFLEEHEATLPERSKWALP